MYNSDMNQLNQRIYYTIINGKMYISGIKGRLTLKYQKLPKVLVNTIDVCDLIDADEIIAKISAGEILYDLEEVDDAQTKLIQGYKMLREYYAYYSSLIKKQNTIQAQPFNLYSTYARNSYRNR